MTQPSYDLPDTATRQALREALDLRMETLKGHLLLRADEMIRLAINLIEPRDVLEVHAAVCDLTVELRGVARIANEMRGIQCERSGL